MALNPSDLIPKRNPGLIARVMSVFALRDPMTGPQEGAMETSQSGLQVDMNGVTAGDMFTNPGQKRLEVYADVEEMDEHGTIVQVAFDTITTNTCTSDDGVQQSFQTTSKQPEVQKVIDETDSTLNLHQKVRPMIRNVLKYGDGFGELVINADLELVDLKQLPPATMHRNQDEHGNLKLGKPTWNATKNEWSSDRHEVAYAQWDPNEPKHCLAQFYPWQIVHTRLNWDGMSAYGKAHMRTGRSVWKKLRQMEESLVVGRLTRDYMKLVFYIDTTGLTRIEAEKVIREFKANVQQRGRVDNKKSSEMSVMTDFFLSDGYVRVNGQAVQRKSRIESIDPKNAANHDVTDIEHVQRQLISATRVPPAHMGYERDLNAKATLTQQDVQYVRFLRDLQQLVGQSLEQVYDTALALAGIDPKNAEYRIAWPMLKATDELSAAQAAAQYALADAAMLGTGQSNATPVITVKWILMNRYNLTPDEAQEIMDELKVEADALEAKQNAQADKQHQQTLEITKAKTPAQNEAEGGGAAGTPQGRTRPVAAEATWLAQAISDRTMELLRPDIESVHSDQMVTLESARELVDRSSLILELPEMVVRQESPTAGAPVVNVHMHEGMIQHTANVDASVKPGAVTVEHKMEPGAVTAELHTHVDPTPIENHTHVPAPNVLVQNDVHPSPAPNVEVHHHAPEPRKMRATKQPDGSVVAEPVDEGSEGK